MFWLDIDTDSGFIYQAADQSRKFYFLEAKFYPRSFCGLLVA